MGDLEKSFDNLHHAFTALDPIGKKLDEYVDPILGRGAYRDKPKTPAAADASVRAMPAPPTRDEKQAVLTRRRDIARQRARSGRASTVLTDSIREKLGGM